MLATLLLASALTIQDYATMPLVSSPMISPDGKRIVYVLSRADLERSVYDTDLWLIGVDGSNDTRLTRSLSTNNHPRWSPDGSRIAFLSDRDGGRNAIWIIGANGGEAEKLTTEKSSISDFEWSPDGKVIAFVMREPPPAEKEDFRVVGDDPRPPHLYLLNVESRAVTRLTRGPFSVTNPSWSPDGSLIAAEYRKNDVLDSELREIAVVSVEAGALARPRVAGGAPATTLVASGINRNPSFSPDGKSIAFLGSGGVDDWLREQQIYVVPVEGGTPSLASRDYGRTPDQIVWGDAQTIWFDGPWNTTSQIFRVGADGTGFSNVSHVDGLISGLNIRNGVTAFVMQSLTTPPELFVWPMKQLTHHNDALRNRDLGETRLIRWKNPKDGLEIEGLLTLPIGYQPGKRYPMLTFVHGGPASHHDQGFFGYLGPVYAPQVLADKGFVILRPNPRGSGGYGEKFREANRNDWGGGDWADINAGIDKVIADGIADPNRLGLMGWSYGGFMAAWAEGHSDRLKAISIGAPIVDLLSYHGTTDIRGFIPSYFHGSPELLREHSPLWHLQPTTARILIQQGDADDRVPLSQGTMLYRMLQEMGVDVTMVIYPRSPHVPREPRERVDVMRRNLEFFISALSVPSVVKNRSPQSAQRTQRLRLPLQK